MDDIQESNAESQQGRQNGAHWTTNLKKTILVLSLYSAYEQLTADNYTYITNILNIMQLFQRTTIVRCHQQSQILVCENGITCSESNPVREKGILGIHSCIMDITELSSVTKTRVPRVSTVVL